jgi:hypothetical protein
MAFRTLKHEYHESTLVDFQFGSTREIIFEINLSEYMNANTPTRVHLRFDSIRNYEEVCVFFERIKAEKKDWNLIGVFRTDKEKWYVDLGYNRDITIITPRMPVEL